MRRMVWACRQHGIDALRDRSAVLWGIPYLFIEVAVDEMSPAMVAFGRIVVRLRLPAAVAGYKGALRGLRARWKIMVFYFVVEITLPWPLIGFGEPRVFLRLAAILIAAVPLVVALLAIRFDHAERAHGSRLVGLVVGFLGVVVLLGLDVAGRPGRAARRGGDPARRGRLRGRADGRKQRFSDPTRSGR